MNRDVDAGLHEHRARLAAIVDSSDDAIVSKDVNGMIKSWNRGAERMFGWTAAEAVGRHITLIIPVDRHHEEDEVLARLRRGEAVEHFETVRITKSGQLLDISITVSPIKDERGRIIGASKIARDITERRRHADEREQLLAREREAREQAEAASRAKDELLAIVSHELRTPLNSILGYARMLQDDVLDEAARAHAVEVIARNTVSQMQLIEELLDLSGIVTGRMQLSFERCDLTKLVAEAIDTVRPAAAAKSIEVVTELAPGVGPILGAPSRLRQIVWNLAMNAIKFTPPSGRVDVTLDESEHEATLVLADNGVGISPDVLPYIFEPFRQEDRSTTRAHSGLGLGLALVKQLVEVHGGHVRAESAGKGQGARFTVTIPRAAESGPRPEPPEDTSPAH